LPSAARRRESIFERISQHTDDAEVSEAAAAFFMIQFIVKGVFIESMNDVADALRFQWLIDCSCFAEKLTTQRELSEAVGSRALSWKIFTFSLMNINFSSGEVAFLAFTLFVRRCLFIRAMSFFALISVSLFDRSRFISLKNSIQ